MKTLINNPGENLEKKLNISEWEHANLRSYFPVTWNEVSALWFEIIVEGLSGGKFSPILDKEGANAAKLLGRILYALEEELEFVLSEIETDTGEGDIPAAGKLLLGIAEEDRDLLLGLTGQLQEIFEEEYLGAENNLQILVRECGPEALPALHPVDLQKQVFYLIQLPCGIEKLSSRFTGEVETACNIEGIDLLPDGMHYRIRLCSSIVSTKKALEDKISYLTEFLGGEIDNGYPVME